MAYYLSNPEQEAKEYSSRYRWLYGFVGLALFLLFCRLWYLQIVQGAVLREFSEKNRIKETQIAAQRGVVLDRNGEVLVDNLPGFAATITPQYSAHLDQTAEAVSRIINVPKEQIVRNVKRSRRRNGPFFPYKVKDNLSREEVFRLKLLRLNHPGLEINETIVRSYPLKDNGAQLFGYVGEISKKQLPLLNKKRKEGSARFRQGDIIGKSGLEERFDEQLRGERGVSFLEVDARGRELSRGSSSASKVLGKIARFRQASPGRNIQLTIDKDVQLAAYKAFNETGRIGSVTALTPEGEVIAWVNSPSYNPNDFSTGISRKLWQQLVNDPFHPLRNKVIQDHGPPGSTFKPIVALAALQEKLITPKTTYFCPGYFNFARRRYACGAKHGHGKVDLFSAIERSCNVFFYRLGAALGIDRIAKYASALGIGKKTGIQLFNEVPGLMPTKKWKKENRGEEWQPGENLSNAIGQGFILTTPLQMASVYSAIATGGKIYKPYIVQSILDHKGEKTQTFSKNFITDLSSGDTPLISKENFEHIREGMRRVVNGRHGTARGYKLRKVPYAGKSGTVQHFSLSAEQIYAKCDEKPVKQRHHGWFVGFAPVENPVISVAVLAEYSCSGSRGAAPVVRDVIKSYLSKYHPELMGIKKEKSKVALYSFPDASEAP